MAKSNSSSKQAPYHRPVTAGASSSGTDLHFLGTLHDRLSASQLLQGQRFASPSLSPMDTDRSDLYFLNNSHHFLVVIFFPPKHTLLFSFPGLSLPPALATFTCTQDLSPHPWATLWFAHHCCPARTHLPSPLYLLSISFSSHLISAHGFLEICLNAEKTEAEKPRRAQQAASGSSRFTGRNVTGGQERCFLGKCTLLEAHKLMKETGNDASCT